MTVGVCTSVCVCVCVYVERGWVGVSQQVVGANGTPSGLSRVGGDGARDRECISVCVCVCAGNDVRRQNGTKPEK